MICQVEILINLGQIGHFHLWLGNVLYYIETTI